MPHCILLLQRTTSTLFSCCLQVVHLLTCWQYPVSGRPHHSMWPPNTPDQPSSNSCSLMAQTRMPLGRWMAQLYTWYCFIHYVLTPHTSRRSSYCWTVESKSTHSLRRWEKPWSVTKH